MVASNTYHTAVLLNEAVSGLAIRKDGTYVDLTFGGGGHSCAILDALGPAGRLIVFDQDRDAEVNIPQDERLTFVPSNFRHYRRWLDYLQVLPVDGVLADLGVSSFQIDTAERGFSFMADGPLDMRMNASLDTTAADVLAQANFDELVYVLSAYGEVRNAKSLARKIIEAREKGVVFRSTRQLATFLEPLAKGPVPRYWAQVFQALRMAVNNELGVLEEMLLQASAVLRPGGRLAVITFHSLEDRMVKRFFRSGNTEGKVAKDDFGKPLVPWKLVAKKPIEASEEERKQNPRSRSAKLRIAAYSPISKNRA